MNTTVKASAAQQSGFNDNGVATDSVTSEKYIWTKPDNTDDTGLISYFTEDGTWRVLGHLNNDNKLVITNNTYSKTESLKTSTNYTN